MASTFTLSNPTGAPGLDPEDTPGTIIKSSSRFGRIRGIPRHHAPFLLGLELVNIDL
jgi:hypothetical protein